MQTWLTMPKEGQIYAAQTRKKKEMIMGISRNAKINSDIKNTVSLSFFWEFPHAITYAET